MSGVRWIIGCTLAAALWNAPALAADPLEEPCDAANQRLAGSCVLDLPEQGDWSLTTRVVVGEAGKQEVGQVEEAFCKAAWRAQRSGMITRWNTLPGTTGNGARMEWRCGLPPVAGGPR